MSVESMEGSVDAAIKRADFNDDGYISWDEYMYSLKLEMAQAQQHTENNAQQNEAEEKQKVEGLKVRDTHE